MSLTGNHWTFIKVVTIGGFCMAMAYGVFKGGISARVNAVEKTTAGNSSEIKVLNKHAAKADADMIWIKEAVKGYDVKQTTVLNAIEALKKP